MRVDGTAVKEFLAKKKKKFLSWNINSTLFLFENALSW